jgi:hypothetical protein
VKGSVWRSSATFGAAFGGIRWHSVAGVEIMQEIFEETPLVGILIKFSKSVIIMKIGTFVKSGLLSEIVSV